MFSKLLSHDRKRDQKNDTKCSCVNIPLGQGGQNGAIVEVECSSHPGLCILDDEGVCAKRDHEAHCSTLPFDRAGDENKTSAEEVKKNKCGNRKYHYKIDINNSEDTGMVADKQCQTCGPDCDSIKCSIRSRAFFISWDKSRSKLFLVLVLSFILWIFIYLSLSFMSAL